MRAAGVGRKTAACVLLFAFGARDVPVDTHVGRVATRLALLRPERSSEQHDAMVALTPRGAELELHVNLLRHGRRTCHARTRLPSVRAAALLPEPPRVIVTTWLELTGPAQLRPARDPGDRAAEIEIRRADPPDGALSRWFYIEVGRAHAWTDHLGRDGAAWEAWAMDVETWILTVGGGARASTSCGPGTTASSWRTSACWRPSRAWGSAAGC